ncbi:MAG TPA: hypothetical protein VE959_31775 [Bryobacteraceae bacterium]|nr:hypothetical protein [Bryobacteraceae bacterium]
MNGQWPGLRREWSRREFLTYASIPGWFPFFRPRHISLAGAHFRIVRYGRSKRRYLLIHGNEETARQVLTQHIRSHQGIAYIIESHTRNVSIESGQIDPNRMFSRVGAERSLKRLNPDWTPDRVQAALAALDRGRGRLLKALLPPPGGLLVALHNNSAGYSVADEEPISDAKSIREPDNLHAFFLCTNPDDFKILAASGYNAVLQQKAPKEDDGSLSRLAAARGIRYVNVEVAVGHGGRLQEMLDWLEWSLK